jgi:regulator of replication initiation timing
MSAQSDIERLLQASIDFQLMRKTVAELADELQKVMTENDHLRAENRLLELKLQRINRPRLVS